jgi:hypothetical protein
MAAGALSSLAAMAVYFLIGASLGTPLELTQQILIIGLIVLCVAVPVSLKIVEAFEERIKIRIKPQLEDEVRPLVEKDVNAALESNTGIIKVFPNFPACEHEILQHTKKTKSVRVFLQMGKAVAVGRKSYYEFLAEAKLQNNAEIRVLHASPSSPYLNEKRAKQRGSRFDEWQAHLNHAKSILNAISNRADINLNSRQHSEAYTWRMFIFDDYAYIQPYLYANDNSENAPVLKISRVFTTSDKAIENAHSLYNVFSYYFDTKWTENSSNTDS